MITYDEALAIVLDTVEPMKPVRVAVEDALGLVLARDVKARLRMPRFDQSAMDGIAVRVEDVEGATAQTPVRLEVVDEIPAGSARAPALRPKTAIKVFTGSRVPRNTGGVVMVEQCRFRDREVEVLRAPRPGEHVRRAGEEVERGETILEAGHRVTPPVIGVLTLFGNREIMVHPAPVVGVITMGDELVAPGAKLTAVQIHDSNGPAIRAALHAMGVRSIRSWRVKDRPAQLARAFRSALAACDVVISCGGASVGDHDHVAAARCSAGISELFSRVAIKPGKPNVFGVGRGGVPVFSLPGNPVSALVSFRQLVRPGLLRMMGRPTEDGTRLARLGADHSRGPGRLEWVRAITAADGTVAPVAAQGSHMLTGLALADVLIEFDPSVERAARLLEVPVRDLRWFE